MILYVNTGELIRSQLEITGLPRLRRGATAVPGARTRSVRIKIFYSERAGCYGPLPVLARRGRNGGVRRLMRLLIDQEAGAMGFESFWSSDGALMDSGDVIAASAVEAARRPRGNGDP